MYFHIFFVTQTITKLHNSSSIRGRTKCTDKSNWAENRYRSTLKRRTVDSRLTRCGECGPCWDWRQRWERDRKRSGNTVWEWWDAVCLLPIFCSQKTDTEDPYIPLCVFDLIVSAGSFRLGISEKREIGMLRRGKSEVTWVHPLSFFHR